MQESRVLAVISIRLHQPRHENDQRLCREIASYVDRPLLNERIKVPHGDSRFATFELENEVLSAGFCGMRAAQRQASANFADGSDKTDLRSSSSSFVLIREIRGHCFRFLFQ